MVSVTVRLHRGIPRALHAEGHAALGADGTSAACAAISAALKAFALALIEHGSCRVHGDVTHSGRYDLEITRCRSARWLRGAWEVTRLVLEETKRAWPEQVDLNVLEE